MDSKTLQVHRALGSHEWIEFVKDWGLEPEFRKTFKKQPKPYNITFERRVCKVCGLVEFKTYDWQVSPSGELWAKEDNLDYIELTRQFGEFVKRVLKL